MQLYVNLKIIKNIKKIYTGNSRGTQITVLRVVFFFGFLRDKVLL